MLGVVSSIFYSFWNEMKGQVVGRTSCRADELSADELVLGELSADELLAGELPLYLFVIINAHILCTVETWPKNVVYLYVLYVNF
jgi:hypothetical protein